MTEATFLRQFKKHCEMARDCGMPKSHIEDMLKNSFCPFLGTVGIFFLKMSKTKAATYYNRSRSKPIPKMLKVLDGVKWRVR